MDWSTQCNRHTRKPQWVLDSSLIIIRLGARLTPIPQMYLVTKIDLLSYNVIPPTKRDGATTEFLRSKRRVNYPNIPV